MKISDYCQTTGLSFLRDGCVVASILVVTACTPVGGGSRPDVDPSAAQAATPTPQPPVMTSAPGTFFLDKGLRAYDDGSYEEAAVQFKNALELGLLPRDQVSARKHLAFAYCVSGRERLCADEFRKVLELMPNFELGAAELGHPLWGPVFKRVKASRKVDTKK